MSVDTERSSTESSAASGLDFEDTALTLTLRLPGSVSPSSSSSSSPDPDRKRASSDADHSPLSPANANNASDAPPAPKARVVGWPPVRSYRKNALADVAGSSKASNKFVKVAVDSAPYLRKVDLQAYAGYEQLLWTLSDWSSCSSSRT